MDAKGFVTLTPQMAMSCLDGDPLGALTEDIAVAALARFLEIEKIIDKGAADELVQ
jgi:hypothetical protein